MPALWPPEAALSIWTPLLITIFGASILLPRFSKYEKRLSVNVLPAMILAGVLPDIWLYRSPLKLTVP